MTVLTVIVCLAGGLIWAYIALTNANATPIETIVMVLLSMACFVLGWDYLDNRLRERQQR